MDIGDYWLKLSIGGESFTHLTAYTRSYRGPLKAPVAPMDS